jgi:hypothetical protein
MSNNASDRYEAMQTRAGMPPVFNPAFDANKFAEELGNKIFAIETNLDFIRGREPNDIRLKDACAGIQQSLEQLKDLKQRLLK